MRKWKYVIHLNVLQRRCSFNTNWSSLKILEFSKHLLKSFLFRDITPFSPLKVNLRFGRCHLHLQDWRMNQARNLRENFATCFYAAFCSAHFYTLKMEAKSSSETSVDFQRTTRRYIPEHRTLHNHRCENLKYYSEDIMFYCIVSR
jgi:hypothetical protein